MEEIISEKKESNPEMSDLGLPIPKPKRGRPRKDAVLVENSEISEPVATEATPVSEPALVTVENTVTGSADMSVDVAKTLKADIGNYKGMTLGEIYETAPKNLVFLVRNSASSDVKKAATIICRADFGLSERFGI